MEPYGIRPSLPRSSSRRPNPGSLPLRIISLMPLRKRPNRESSRSRLEPRLRAPIRPNSSRALPLRKEREFGRIPESPVRPKPATLPLREARGGSSLGGSRSIGERARIMSTGIIGYIGLLSPMESGGVDMEALSISSRIRLD